MSSVDSKNVFKTSTDEQLDKNMQRIFMFPKLLIASISSKYRFVPYSLILNPNQVFKILTLNLFKNFKTFSLWSDL